MGDASSPLYCCMQHPEHVSFLLGSRKQPGLSLPQAPTLKDKRCGFLNSFVSADGRSSSLLLSQQVENRIATERIGMQDHSSLLIKASIIILSFLFAYLIATLTQKRFPITTELKVI